VDDHRRCICVYVRLFDFSRGAGKKLKGVGVPKNRRWENRSLVGFDLGRAGFGGGDELLPWIETGVIEVLDPLFE